MVSDAERIEHRRLDEVHDCVAPSCGARAVEAFLVGEHGRLAGRVWKPGDMIDLCAPHAHDVRQAEYLPREQVAEWVRADMKTDPYKALMDCLEGL